MPSPRLLPALGLLPLLASCAVSGGTKTVLVNASAGPLVLTCVADSTGFAWPAGPPGGLGALQAACQADTCFFTRPGRVAVVWTLAAGDSATVGVGTEAFIAALTTPRLGWETVTVQSAGRGLVRLTGDNLEDFVAGSYQEHKRCCGEYLEITRVYRVLLPRSE